MASSSSKRRHEDDAFEAKKRARPDDRRGSSRERWERDRGGGGYERERERERDSRDARDYRDRYSDRRDGGRGDGGRRDDYRRDDRRDDRRGAGDDYRRAPPSDSKYSAAASAAASGAGGVAGAAAAAAAPAPASASSAAAAAGRALSAAEEAAARKQREDDEYQRKVEAQLKALESSAAEPLTEEQELELARKRRAERMAKIAAAAAAAKPPAPPAAAAAQLTAPPAAVATPAAAAALAPPPPPPPPAPPVAAPARPNGVAVSVGAPPGGVPPAPPPPPPPPPPPTPPMRPAAAAAAAPVPMALANGKHTPVKPAAAAAAAAAPAPAAAPAAAAATPMGAAAMNGAAAVPPSPSLRKPAAAAASAAELDMFALDEPAASAAGAGAGAAGGTALGATAGVDDAALQDNWDDPEGYYKFMAGDVLDGRYTVFALQGRGVFSTVLRVRDGAPNMGQRELVVKVVRVDASNTFRKAGQKELEFLKLLADKDPDNKKHCVRLISFFEHRSHLCMVFEPLSMNLREVLKKYGGTGLSVLGVKSFAKQLFVALKHLKKCQLIHADLKPDNILVNENKSVVKVCDFGSAGKINESEITPYLVSRFYRAPEIMLGLPYNEALDVWSVGCILYELYTGKILFPGNNNNEMLRLQQELKGPFPNKMLKKAQFRAKHFDEDFTFEQTKKDPVTGIELKRKIKFLRPTRELHQLMLGDANRLSDTDRKRALHLADLCNKCFALDPTKRITVEQALLHPFIKDL